MDVKTVLGFVLAFGLGALCRVFELPLPAPPVFIGAMLVVAMTVGYTLVDKFVSRGPSVNEGRCGGPLG